MLYWFTGGIQDIEYDLTVKGKFLIFEKKFKGTENKRKRQKAEGRRQKGQRGKETKG